MEHSRRALEGGEGLVQVGFVLASGLCLNDHIREAACGISAKLPITYCECKEKGGRERKTGIKSKFKVLFPLPPLVPG